MSDVPHSLNEMQRAFCREYLLDFNATAAAKRAGYAEDSANATAGRLMAIPRIHAYISGEMEKRATRTHVTQDRVLLEIARLAFNDPRKVFDSNGRLLPVKEWSDDVAACISSLKVTEVAGSETKLPMTVTEVKFWDKGKSLDLAARHLGMLNDKLAVKADIVIDPGLTAMEAYAMLISQR